MEVLTQDQWVLQKVAGYQLELISVPYQTHMPHQIQTTTENATLITAKVVELLWAILETQLSPNSYLSQICLVEKKDGGQRPVINLKGLNQFLKQEHFKMEGLHLLPDLLQPGDWMANNSSKLSNTSNLPLGREVSQIHLPTLQPDICTEVIHKAVETRW